MRKEAIRELAEDIHVLFGPFDPKSFISPASTPVVSIYVPVHRTEREDRRDEWDKIEFKDLCNEAYRTLSESFDEQQYAGIKEKLEFILSHEDLPLWIDASAGLAFLVNNQEASVFNLSFAPEPCVVVGDKYYIKPLIRNAQYALDYKLLLLNTDFFALLDGDYNGVHYVALPDDVKNYFAETFPEFDGETTALDYYSLEDHESPYHDHKSRHEVTAEEAEKFFRYVNKAMNDTLVRDDKAPVILVTAPEHEHLFRQICTFDSLLPEGIAKDPRTLSGTQLRDDAVAIMQKIQDAKLGELKEKYGYHASKGNATDEITAIGMALAERKVGVLFIEAGKGIPGTFDATTGEVFFDGATDPVDDKQLDPASPDIANAFIEAAVAQDAQILILDHEKMPVAGSMAAIYRY